MKGMVLTGIKPTGTPHIGNLVGAIEPVVRLARDYDRSTIFIADLHALNAVTDAGAIARWTHEVALALLAAGIDPDRTLFFRQSDVPEVYQLTLLLMNVTPKGLMNRAHAYKASIDANAAAGRDPDVGVNMGLYTYPILMAADILLYGADCVPVGKDQKQHVEFARDIANSFNTLYRGEHLRTPEPVVFAGGEMIPGLDGRKMSKSYNNTIPLFASDKEVWNLVKKIKTDSRGVGEPKEPDSLSLFQIYRHLGTSEEAATLRSDLEGGIGYGDAKKRLAELIDRRLEPFRAAAASPGAEERVETVLREGAERARTLARETVATVQQAMLGRSAV
jgi:tryptophanyl-tRNA synthetase